ncbi:MAG: DUF2505 family protein [Pseudomonadota bacterium]
MFSKEYYIFLKSNHSAVDEIEVIEQTFEDDRVVREVKYTPRPIIRKIGPKEVPKDAMVFVERSTYDRGRHVLDFENVPKISWVAKRLKNSGTMTFTREGGRTRRVVAGELKVKFPILGAIAERIIYSQARKILEEEVECFKKYIKSKE